MRSHYAEVNGVRLHYVEEGSGPLVLLLHGFPDFWYSWRHQIPFLVDAGYRVVAPDLRGYNESGRPVGVESYRLEVLAQDIVALLRVLQADTPARALPVVIGHDWGGTIAWHLAMHHARSIGALAVLNAPHPVSFARELRSFSSQPLRSSYAAFFQLPRVPETMLSAFDFALLRRTLRRGPAPQRDDLGRYLAVFREPGALTAPIDYYRAAVRYPPRRPKPIRHPALLLWGRRDPFLVPALTRGLERWVPALRVEMFEHARHWLHHSHAPAVNAALGTFLGDHVAATPPCAASPPTPPVGT